ncbi:HAD hydrolase-like protein [Fibrobacter sp. UWH4]|uniref:HAD hydrolase-like protein n=1 Tax=Fibrobacter sp. UWH4 TaxID=1896210 RepID=UPI000914250F|nr:HAD hydrolase-like protein [Fibrobacter sp. UWH4]SHL62690.1 Predicted hydrolase, HAD superfamily [Fibrobacter sp. UWH4]
MKREYVSFDVFDTCLIRRCGRPYKIWDLMADRLFEKDYSRGRLSFTGNRSLAEKKASYGSPYPTLDDIYQELNVAQWGFEKDSMMNLEMEIEEQELFPNPEMLKTVNQYREKGFKIAFVSDMYLPTEFIRKVLTKYGFCQEPDLVFVSAYCKASKYDGKLFDFVLRETQTKAKQWIHYGDNERSDYRVPKSRGIKTILVNDTDFTDEEKRWIDDARFYTHKHEIELWAGLCRLTRLQNERSFAATMAVDFIASVYVPYVAYVLRTAKEKGIKTLYFLARDGHIFLEIAKAMKAESEGIECRYLKVSRRALYSCVFYEVNDFELSVVINNAHDQPIKQCLEYIGIKWDDLSVSTKKLFGTDVRLNSRKKIVSFINTIKENDSSLLKSESQKKRALLLRYLKQEKIDEQKSALVDLGWIGSCKAVIDYILKNEKLNAVDAFYWGYGGGLIYGREKLYVFNEQIDAIYYHPALKTILESYASINSEGTTLGYEERNGVIIPIKETNSAGKENIEKKHSLIISSLVTYIPRYCSDSIFTNDVFLCCGLRQIRNILTSPKKKHVRFFEKISCENYNHAMKIVERFGIKDVLALMVWGVPASMIWAEAASIKSFGPFAPLFSRLYKYSSMTAFANRLRLWWENRA